MDKVLVRLLMTLYKIHSKGYFQVWNTRNPCYKAENTGQLCSDTSP